MVDQNNGLNAETLLSVLGTADPAIAVYSSKELHISFVNDGMLRIWGKGRNVKGQTFEDAMPEMKGQPFAKILKNVWETGKSYIATNTPADLVINGHLITSYFDFEYRPLLNSDGNTYAILHTATDVTDLLTYKHLVNEKSDRDDQLRSKLTEDNATLTTTNASLMADNAILTADNEVYKGDNAQLNTTNKELSTANVAGEERNKRLTSANTDLNTLNDLLNRANERLTQLSTERQNLNEELTVTNEELELLNDQYLAANEELTRVGKEKQTLNDSLVSSNLDLQALNEEYLATNEQLKNLNAEHKRLNNELKFTNEELLALNEELNVTSEELHTLSNEHIALNEELISTNEELKKRNEEYLALNDRLAVSLETAHLSKTAANLGTFDLDVVNDKLEWDDRCKELFGISPNVKVTYSVDFVKGLHKDDRKRIVQAVNDAYNFDLTGGRYDVEYRTVGAEDGKLRWVRAIGQVSFNYDKQPQRFIGTVLDITEQKEDEQRKNDFIGMVSHELKTPLTSLSGYLQIMGSSIKKTGDNALLNLAERSVIQVKKMTTMINGFLNVSRFEAGKIHIDLQEFDLATLVKEVEEESVATITSHKVVFHPMERTMVNGDRDKIGQVINNLISNAVKYSPQGTEINIACVSENGYANASITDEGMGIAEKDLDKLFDRYYRVEGAQMKSISGFGIGLYLSSEIIRRHKGEIGAESEIGKGSTFWFKLPLSKN